MANDSELIKKLERRIQRLKILLDLRVNIATDIIEEEIIDEIKSEMFAANYSIRIIDNVELRDVKIEGKKINYKIFNELIVGDGFDIAKGMEEGIIPHDIFGNPLAWEGQTVIGTPTTIFATHVKHPGVQATHIIQNTVRQKNPTIQSKYTQSMKEKIQQITNSS